MKGSVDKRRAGRNQPCGPTSEKAEKDSAARKSESVYRRKEKTKNANNR
jgi:hypothetical protein